MKVKIHPTTGHKDSEREGEREREGARGGEREREGERWRERGERDGE
jgi:hypothetical protein